MALFVAKALVQNLSDDAAGTRAYCDEQTILWSKMMKSQKFL